MRTSRDDEITTLAFSEVFKVFESKHAPPVFREVLSGFAGGEEIARDVLKAVGEILAGKTLAQGLGIDQKEIEALHMLARMQSSERRYLEAMQFYGLLITLDQNDPRFYKGLGLAVKALGENEKAIECLTIVRVMDPGDLEVVVSMAECHFACGRKEIAQQTLQKMLDKSSGNKASADIMKRASAILEMIKLQENSFAPAEK